MLMGIVLLALPLYFTFGAYFSCFIKMFLSFACQRLPNKQLLIGCARQMQLHKQPGFFIPLPGGAAT
jgi:hypothetical protein